MKRLMLATLLAILPVTAQATTLPIGSLMCEEKSDMDEAVQAVAITDVEWLKTLRSCFLTAHEMNVGIIATNGHAMTIRVWWNGQTEIAYAYDIPLSHK